MGWNPIKDIKRATRHVTSGDWSRDLRREAGNAGRNINDAWNRLPDIGKGLANPLLYLGEVVDENFINPKQPQPPSPETDPRAEQLRNELRQDADNFRKNIDDYKKRQVRGLLPIYNQALSQGTKRTRENFGRRGLLYSGLRQSGETSVRGELASKLAGAKIDINREAEDLARKKEMAAAAAGLERSQDLLNQAEQYYNLTMQNQIERRRALGNLARGVGYAAGTFAGQTNNQGLLASENSGPTGSQSLNYGYYGQLLGAGE